MTAQLIDATTGSHVWASRYDRDLADVFVVQDEITAAIATAIAPAIIHAEQERDSVNRPSGSTPGRLTTAACGISQWAIERALQSPKPSSKNP